MKCLVRVTERKILVSFDREFQTIFALLFLCGVYGHVDATTLPKYYTEKHVLAREERSLDYMIVRVNDERKVVIAGKTLTIVRGDTFVVEKARLKSSQGRIAEVNIVGLKSTRKPGGRQDLGVVVTSGTGMLNPKWADHADGETYAVVAASPGVLHGVIKIRVLEPRLDYIALLVNGESRVFRAEEKIRLKGVDEIEIQRVTTNLNDDKGVAFTLKRGRMKSSQMSPQGEYSLTVSYQGLPFASIPITVSD
ncbi:MAG: hypothetical protein OXT67_07120 [Zetaproteobacteria bacterium]|nr:hypothetical protein [Zetaproteobacteria bacterium]